MKSVNIFIKRNAIKVVFESSLIIFSVLLALFLNEYREELARNQEKERALKMVNAELKSNLNTLNEWLPYHKEVLKNLEQSFDDNHDNHDLSFNDQYTLITSSFPKGIVQTMLDNSSWEAIKQSNVSSTIDLDIIFSLSKLYKVQSLGIESTLQRTLMILSSRESIREGNLRETIFLLKNHFNELVGQEVYMIEVYEKLIEEIESLDAGDGTRSTKNRATQCAEINR
jgi:hypothetical protein